MNPKALVELLVDLPAQPPITTALEARLSKGDRAKQVWYRTQKEHLIRWLTEYDSPGAYGRKVHSGRSAAFAYNHIMCPPMALWLGEAVGLAPEVVQKAADAVINAGDRLPAQNAALRKIIPWTMIEARLSLLQREQAPWRKRAALLSKGALRAKPMRPGH